VSNVPERHTRVLVLIEKPLVADVVRLTLNYGTFVTRHARDVREACEVLDAWRPQLAVVDIDGFGDQVVRRIASWGPPGRDRLPVLAVTRRGDLKTKLAAFDLGVDDIMTLPLSPEELLARVLVISRRGIGAVVALDPVLKIGEMEIDIVNRRLRAGAADIHLSGMELNLLYLLAANAGQTVTHDDILDVVWGVDYVAESNVVGRQVRQLRAKLGDDWQKPRFIATVPGQGYRFIHGLPERQFMA
jgi:two-component system KDP operon response regulator KdpE